MPAFGKQRRPFGNPVADPKSHVAYIPPPSTNLQNLNLPLDIVLPQSDQAIQQAEKLVFHSVGDTGGFYGPEVEEAVAKAMESQIGKPADAGSALFCYNLGDVIYFNGQSQSYPHQFYEPYQFYPAPIFAIPGNHDGDNKPLRGDAPDSEPPLYGFMQNFCDSQPRHLSPYRPTMTQPYVYWTLETPLLTLVGLYSNVDGLLDGPGTFEQQRWLQQQLQAAPADKCLVVAVHHPPYSLDKVHGGYRPILDALDRAASAAKRWPDAVLSGHVHSYQRFSREVNGRQLPYIVAGAGGHANTLHRLHQIQPDAAGKINLPVETTEPGVALQSFNDTEAGFLRITVTPGSLLSEYFVVPLDGSEPATQPFDQVTVPWGPR